MLGTVPSLEWKPIRLTVCSNGMVFRSSTEIKPYGLYIFCFKLGLPERKIFRQMALVGLKVIL